MSQRNNKAKNKQTTKETNSTKEFFQNHWGTLANLLMTVIAGVIIVIYLQKDQQRFEIEQQAKNEEFQKQFIDLQSKSQLSVLEIQTKTEGHPQNKEIVLHVRNTGPAIANNIHISFCIDYVNETWIDTVNSIDQFEFINEKASIKMSSEIIESVDCLHGGTSGVDYAKPGNVVNSSLLLTFPQLPPNEELPIHIRLKRLATQKAQYNGEAVIDLVYFPDIAESNNTSNQGVNMDYIQEGSLDQTFFVAKLNMDVACENCNTKFKSANQDIYSIYFPSWVSTEWKDLLQTEDDFLTKLQFKINVEYKIPENSTKTMSGSPIKFKVLASNDENQDGDIVYVFLPPLESILK